MVMLTITAVLNILIRLKGHADLKENDSWIFFPKMVHIDNTFWIKERTFLFR